jgi:hypothetical protein
MMMADTFLFLCLQFWQASPLREELPLSVIPIIASRFHQRLSDDCVLERE